MINYNFIKTPKQIVLGHFVHFPSLTKEKGIHKPMHNNNKAGEGLTVMIYQSNISCYINI